MAMAWAYGIDLASLSKVAHASPNDYAGEPIFLLSNFFRKSVLHINLFRNEL